MIKMVSDSFLNVIDFLENAEQLKKATFSGMGTNKYKAAAEQLQNNWEYVGKSLSACIFIR